MARSRRNPLFTVKGSRAEADDGSSHGTGEMSVPRNARLEWQQTPQERIPIEHSNRNRPDDLPKPSVSDPRHDHKASQSVNQAARTNMSCGPAKQPQQKPTDEDDHDDINNQLFRMKNEHEGEEYDEGDEFPDRWARLT